MQFSKDLTSEIRSSATKCGVLFKRGMGVFVQTWKERYFEFHAESKMLVYFYIDTKNNRTTRRGEVVLDLIDARMVSPQRAEGHEFAFEINCYKSTNSVKSGDVRTLMLAAHDEIEAIGWLQAFNDAIETHRKRHREAVSRTLKFGYMYKKGPTYLRPWKMRYFVLTNDGTMTYYENERDFTHQHTPLGRFSLGNIAPGNKNEPMMVSNFINIHLISGRLYELRCETGDLATEWVNTIQNYNLTKTETK